LADVERTGPIQKESCMDPIQTLMAIEEIRRVEAAYARHADRKDWDALAALFTEDGVFEPRDVDGNAIFVMKGREVIAQTLCDANGPEVTPIHMFFGAEIDILSETKARSIQSMADILVRDSSAPQPAGPLPAFTEMHGWGHYHSTYRKVGSRWLIENRVQTRTRMQFI
jgi:hypothetical protein